MIYLDSAATSLYKPETVQTAILEAMETMASPGRGAHAPAMRAADCCFACREEIASLFHVAQPEQVIFTFNATHALNIAIRSLVREGTRVLISGYEHNSVTRPLYAMAPQVRIIDTPLFQPDVFLEQAERSLDWADVVVCTHVSNVFGYILPIREIAALCAEQGVPFVVDASQSAGVIELEWDKCPAAFYAMPGHKSLLGVQGSGLLLCAGEGKPLLFGGSGSDSISPDMPDYLPDRLEAGTQNAPAAAALSAGIRYIRRRGRVEIERHERDLCTHMAELLQKAPDLECFCSREHQSGVLSFRSRSRDCEEIAARLAEQYICVRTGLHCAPLAHKSAGTLSTGTVRISFSPFNTHPEVEAFASKLRKII